MVDNPTPETEPTPEVIVEDDDTASECGHVDKNGRVCLAAPHTGQHSYKPKPDPSGESVELSVESYDPVTDATLARIADALEHANRLQAAAMLLSQQHVGFARDGRVTETARQIVIDTLK